MASTWSFHSGVSFCMKSETKSGGAHVAAIVTALNRVQNIAYETEIRRVGIGIGINVWSVCGKLRSSKLTAWCPGCCEHFTEMDCSALQQHGSVWGWQKEQDRSFDLTRIRSGKHQCEFLTTSWTNGAINSTGSSFWVLDGTEVTEVVVWCTCSAMLSMSTASSRIPHAF